MAKIIYLESFYDLRKIVGNVLTMNGHQVELTDSTEIALELLGEQSCDILLTCTRTLPEKCLNFIKKLQQYYPKLKIIVFSGDNTLRGYFLDTIGIHAFVCKNDPIEKLSQVINGLSKQTRE